MKNLLKIGLILIVIISIGACKSGNKPENVAKEFLTALYKCDYEKAKSFGNELTIKMVDMKKMFEGGSDSLVLIEKIKKSENAKVEIINTEMLNDTTAVCQYKVTGIEGKDPEESKIELLKSEGKWIVNWKKEGMGDSSIKETSTESTEVVTDTASVAQ